MSGSTQPVRISNLTPYPGDLQGVGSIPLDDGANAYRISPQDVADYALGGAMIPGGTRTVAQKLSDTVSVLDFGAKGDGVTDDTAAAQAAINTGKNVLFPSGRLYVIAGELTVSTSCQFLTAYGARFKVSGAGSMVVFRGPDGAAIQGSGLRGFNVDAAGKTAGYLFRSSGASRMLIEDVVVGSPWNFLFVEKANYFEAHNLWVNDVRGEVGVHWFGDNARRSDILRLNAVTISSPTARATGVLWDGNCHTLQAQSLNLVLPGYGIRMVNGTGGIMPFFLMGDDIEIDYPKFDGISIEAGGHVYLSPALYIHGSEMGSGIKVAGSVQADTVTVSGGKITGHARYGIETNSRVMEANIHFSGNVLGNYGGTGGTVTKGQRFQLDPQAYFTYGGGNPLIAFDDADYMQFARANNRYSIVVGGAEVAGMGVAGGSPYITSQRFSIDATGYWTLSGGSNPTLAFDSNDYLQYSRAADRVNLVIGATEVLAATQDRVSMAVPVVFRGYAAGAMPAASAVPGATVRVIDRSQRLATSDGSVWRFMDGTVLA